MCASAGAERLGEDEGLYAKQGENNEPLRLAKFMPWLESQV